MNRYHDRERDMAVQAFLGQERQLPEDPLEERIVVWKTFRDPQEARDYAENILLDTDQELVGGYCADSLGRVYWVGVQVPDVRAWGHSMAIHLRDPYDAQDPDSKGHGISA